MSVIVKPARSSSATIKRLRRYAPFYAMLLPGVIYFIINNYVPLAGMLIAFKRMNFAKGFFESDWVGFSNFTYLFRTSDAWIITRNTLMYNALFIALGVIVPIVTAVFLSEIRSAFCCKLYQTSVLLPHLISMIVVSYIVYAFLSSGTGYLNASFLPALGIEPVSWYTAPNYWPFILVIVHVWKSFGYYTVIYYATLVGIDRGYYEAAVLDGASAMRQLYHVTLPFLRPTIITMTLLAVGRMFYSDFGLFYQVPMNSGPLFDVTNTIDTYVYRGLFELNDIGRASAAGVYQSMVGFLLVLGANRLVRKISSEDALF